MKYSFNVFSPKMLKVFCVAGVTLLLGFGLPVFADVSSDSPTGQQQQVIQNARIDTTSASLAVRVAPGELLPVSVKLLNFGGGRKVDVTVTYSIVDQQGNQIYSTTETVAVETTANFVKTIQIPFGTVPGKYTAKASITYQDQLVPATTQFSFTVERKVLGLFQSDFYFYGIIILLVGLMSGVVVHFWMKSRRVNRLHPHEYSQVAQKDRIFYEIISDTIMQMRYRVGDKAIVIAKTIDGLVIDDRDGKVLEIKTSPAKILALLVLNYEKLLGQKISFAIKKPNARNRSEEELDKNLVKVR